MTKPCPSCFVLHRPTECPSSSSGPNYNFVSTGIPDLDRVLGGGLFRKGSITLLYGLPGVGKTTLAIQIAKTIDTYLVSAEQSRADLVKIAERVGGVTENTQLVGRICNLTGRLRAFYQKQPFVVFDSLNSARCDDDESHGKRGSPSQIEALAQAIAEFAHETESNVLMISHDDCELQSIEHLTHTNLHLRYGENGANVLTVTKNRFGAEGVKAVFRMTNTGLLPLVDARN